MATRGADEIKALKRRIRALTILYLASAFVLGVYVYIRKVRPALAPPPVLSVAAVNGENITDSEFDHALRVVSGRQVLRQLMEQKAILQEAKRLNLNVDDQQSLMQLQDLNKLTKDPIAYGVVARDLECRLLVRKILLKDVTESRKHHLYDTFKDTLRQYDVFAIVVENPRTAKEVMAALQHGESFARAASTYSRESRTRLSGGDFGFLTHDEIVTTLGPQVADVVAHLAPGVVSEPIYEPAGLAIVRVGKVRSSYPELKASIEDLIAEAGRTALMYRLTRDASLTSPFLSSGTPFPSPSPSPSSAVFAVPASPPPHPSGSSVFAPAPSTGPLPSASSVFAAPSGVPHPSGSSVFAVPSSVPHPSGSPVFVLPSALPKPSGPSVFAQPAPTHDPFQTPVFDPLRSPTPRATLPPFNPHGK